MDEPAGVGPLWRAAEAHRVLAAVCFSSTAAGVPSIRTWTACFKTDRRDGIRITPEDQIGEIVAVLAGRVNKALVGVIQTHGLSPSACLGDGQAIHTAKATQYGLIPGVSAR